MITRLLFINKGKTVRSVQDAPLPNVGEEVNITSPTGPYWGKVIERAFNYNDDVVTVFIHFD